MATRHSAGNRCAPNPHWHWVASGFCLLTSVFLFSKRRSTRLGILLFDPSDETAAPSIVAARRGDGGDSRPRQPALRQPGRAGRDAGPEHRPGGAGSDRLLHAAADSGGSLRARPAGARRAAGRFGRRRHGLPARLLPAAHLHRHGVQRRRPAADPGGLDGAVGGLPPDWRARPGILRGAHVLRRCARCSGWETEPPPAWSGCPGFRWWRWSFSGDRWPCCCAWWPRPSSCSSPSTIWAAN